MSQQNLLKLVLQKTRALNSWIIAFLTSLDLKTKAQRAIDVTKQALKKLRQLSTHLYQQARHAILLTARYLAKKNTIFRQWSHQNIAPRWARFVVFSKKSFKKFIAFVIWLLRTVTLQIKRLLIYTTIQLENLSKLTFNVLDYVVDNLLSLLVFITDKAILFSRIIAKAVWKGLKLLAGTVTLQIKRLLIYTAIQLENLSKLTFNILDYVVDNLLSLLVFIMDTAILFSRIIAKAVWKGLKLLAGYAAETALFLYLYAQKGLKLLAVYAAEVALFLYLFTQVALIVSIIALRRLNNLLRISTSRLRVYFKSFARFIHIHLVILLKLLDKAFKQAGAYLTIALIKLWILLKLFAQGLGIIGAYLWHLFLKGCAGLLKATKATVTGIDKGFKLTGYFVTVATIKSFELTFLFFRSFFSIIDWATERLVNTLVITVSLLITYTWLLIKYTLLSPIIILKAILPSSVIDHFRQYGLLIRLDKPIGILLLLWPTLMALWIAAKGWPDINVLLVFIAGVFLMRSAGCAINDFADRNIDILVTRTKERPLTSGKITVAETLAVFAFLSLLAFSLVLLMNGLTITMSFVGLGLAASYPFMKRYHYLPQIHLGAAFGWAVPMAFAAQANELAPVAWLLFFATVLWATAYDTMYAMVDREDDLKIGVKSTAILFEDADKLIIGIIQVLLILCFIMIGVKLELGGIYFLSVLIASCFAAYQQFLIKDRLPSKCFQAFLNNNWFGLVLFLGIFLEYQIGNIAI